ncbi:MAG: aldehyde ferredoxin oxidoreductase family protein [Candidatus Hodarchaeota archaeon]
MTYPIGGYKGKLLYIDLSERTFETRILEEQDARMFLGGSGLGSKILFDEMDLMLDPFDSRSLIVLTTGPLVGLPFSYCSRYVVSGKSPTTGGWGEAHAAGFWGPELKFAGFDGLVIRGKAETPIYLLIKDGDGEVRDAKHLWGKDTFETESMIRRELQDPSIRVLSIGEAGERLSKMAAIMSDGGRAAARGGLGAIMGAKHLKAVALKGGDRRIKISNQEGFDDFRREGNKIIKETPSAKMLHDFGTSAFFNVQVEFGNVPTKNWSLGSRKETIDKLSGRTMAQKYLSGRYHCRACVVGCGRLVEVKEGLYETPNTMGPEYETIGAFGNNCMNEDLESIIKMNYLANAYGMDSISAGAVIAFAMECYERGLLTKKDTDGIELVWGNQNAMIELLEKIRKREGIGDLLADGVKVASEKIGGGSDQFAIHVKGLELPMHDPRAFASWAIALTTANRGACHNQAITYGIERGMTYPDIGIDKPLDRFISDESKSKITKIMQDFYSILESLIACKFVVYGGLRLTHLNALLNSVTGWDTDIAELMKTGERLYNLNRLFNVKCGISRKDDSLPWRIEKEALTDGGAKGHLPDLEKMLDPYYKMRDWDEKGIPNVKKLTDLSLGKYL